MKLNNKIVVVRGQEFDVRELTVAQLMPLLGALSEDPQEGQMRIMERSIHVNGSPVGEGLQDYPGAVLLKLMPVVSEINNLGDDEEGKL